MLPRPTEMHRVYAAINRPLTIWGIDRRVWLFGAVVGVTAFNMTTSLLGGLGVFLVIYAVARAATLRDPQLLTIIARSPSLRRRYDPAKFHFRILEVRRSCDTRRG